MKIDGRAIAANISNDLKLRISVLKEKNVTPALAVILIGDVESSEIYVRQKVLKAGEVGAATKIFRFEKDVSANEIEGLIKKLDANPNIHGIILQRPAPKTLAVEKLEEFISPSKEVDGFGQNSLYAVPVAAAVFEILKEVFSNLHGTESFEIWLKSKKIVVVGKGETAGQPIINHFRKLGIEPQIIDSQTKNPNEILQNADIIISAVGKRGVVNLENMKKGVILIGVGLSADDEGKTKGDYDNNEVEKIASFYTPTPGGVGPVNVAILLRNLVEAAQNLSK